MSPIPTETLLERLPLAGDRPWIGHAVAVTLAVVATLLRWSLDHVLPPGYPYLTFFPAVILTAFLFGTAAGVTAALACGAAAFGLFILPQNDFRLTTGVAVSLGFYSFIVAVDIGLIHVMQRATRRLAAERTRSERLAETRTVLFSELQHRISNNLQVVGALLTLQKRGIEDEGARAALDDAARRLGVIGRIHRRLYDPTGGPLGLEPLFRQLTTDTLDAGGRTGVTHGVAVDETIRLEADAAIPVALIVAEAVANALEHGFVDRETGHIDIDLRRVDQALRLEIRDDGHGLPEGFRLDESESLGLRIAALLARQLGGRFELLHDGGAVARLTQPASAAVRD